MLQRKTVNDMIPPSEITDLVTTGTSIYSPPRWALCFKAIQPTIGDGSQLYCYHRPITRLTELGQALVFRLVIPL